MTLMTEQDHSNVSSLRAFASRYCKLSTIVVTTRYYFDGRKTGKSITRTRYVTKAYRHLVFIYVPFLGNHARPSHWHPTSYSPSASLFATAWYCVPEKVLQASWTAAFRHIRSVLNHSRTFIRPSWIQRCGHRYEANGLVLCPRARDG